MDYYRARQRRLLISLGLRFERGAVPEAWRQVRQREFLRETLRRWQNAGLFKPERLSAILAEIERERGELRGKLEGYDAPIIVENERTRLDAVNYVLAFVNSLDAERDLASVNAGARMRAPLLAEQARLESALGLRPTAPPPMEEQPAAVAAPVSPAIAVEPPAAPPPSPPPPRLPLRDRFWSTLLSERTLQALLFVGIFLLFAAAISFVLIGWTGFSAPVRVAIPTGFTALFFALGWYIRNRTELYRSGIALSAIGSLLIPIDLYTVYANFDIPPDFTPTFWTIASLVCLGAYIVVTLRIPSRLFGYLVVVAAGSAALALVELGHQFLNVSLDWRTAALSLLSAALVVAATFLNRAPPPSIEAKPNRVRAFVSAWITPRTPAQLREHPVIAFAEPMRNLALLTVTVVMLFTLGWRYLERDPFDTLHYALTVNWWVGGFIFGWGAIYYRSRGLGILAAITLPVAAYLTQAAIFAQFNINNAWHALGLALLAPLYFFTGHKLRHDARFDDPVLRGHGRTAAGWGIALLVVAALWSLTDLTSGAAAAASHAILAASVVMAAWLWQQPRWMYFASLFSFTSITFAMTQLGQSMSQYSIGWASLAIAHIVIALNAQSRILNFEFRSLTEPATLPLAAVVRDKFSIFVSPLVRAGYVIAALAVLLPLYPYDGNLLAYTLANWIGLAAWGARLAHVGQPGFVAQNATQAKKETGEPRLETGNWSLITGYWSLLTDYWPLAFFHWLTALPLPFWLWVVFANFGALDEKFPLALAALAWACYALARRLARVRAAYRFPWHVTSIGVSIAAVYAAFVVAPSTFAPPIVLLVAGALYFVDAFAWREAKRTALQWNRQAIELAAGALVTAWGIALGMERAYVIFDAVTLGIAAVVVAYIGAGLYVERRRWRAQEFLLPLYLAAHVLAFIVLLRVYTFPFYELIRRAEWTDAMHWWGAAAQVTLGAGYALYAWGTFKQRWAFASVWLAAAGVGFVLLLESTGTGRLALWLGLGAAAMILSERILYRYRRKSPYTRLVWWLYRRPLLVTGWLTSALVIFLALFRNLVWLGGGRIQQTWAAVALLLMVALYALSARLFRQARFTWLAALLVFVPWTILTNLSWLVLEQPSAPAFAISWVLLAWLLLVIALGVARIASTSYALAPKTVAHVLLPFALLWGMFHIDTSRITFALAIAYYSFAAWLDYRRLETGDWRLETDNWRLMTGHWSLITDYSKFLYPALGFVPIWCVYLLASFVRGAPNEIFGLMLIVFAPLGLAMGQWLERIAPRREFGGRYALPAYLTGYIATIFGTLLVAHVPALLSLVLVYDVTMLIVSARVFRNPLWLYPAVVLTPLALGLALREGNVPANRFGWWFLALAALYFAMTWVLRRKNAAGDAPLHAYGTPTLMAGFALIALALPPSSLDREGALWGYAGATLLYVVTAFWLRQPLLLTPASALVVVPYAVVLQNSALEPRYYGLALLLGAVVALALGWLLDKRFGAWRDFPRDAMLNLDSKHPGPNWGAALAERFLNWWALPLYVLGLGLALFSPAYTSGADLHALHYAALMLVFAWTMWRFRLRVWLLACALAGHAAYLAWLNTWGVGLTQVEFGVNLLPIVVVTTLAALWIEKRRGEGSPLDQARVWIGWSRPLYVLAFFDLFFLQSVSLERGTLAGVLITVMFALLLAVLATAWNSRYVPYGSAVLGIVAYQQWLNTLPRGELYGWPVGLAYLTLGYGLVGFALALAPAKNSSSTWRREWLKRMARLWARPLQYVSLLFSVIILLLTLYLGADIVGWTVRALFGVPVREIVKLPVAQMFESVLALLGLLYLGAAFTYRRVRFGYVAIGVLLLAWMIHAFYVQQWDDRASIQWYAIPSGLYLLGIAYLEAQRGHKQLARWIDYAAMTLMMGSLFWQTLLYGWSYALLLGAEGFASFWWGSARRLRRFLYIGILGVVLATLAQLLNALQSVNQWIIFGLIGLLVVVTAILVERKLEDIKAWQQILETWE
ncbi:MAG: hypothetical protein HY741_20950 [Chloroflexi bacterium]|nr:hypothetical protein [Chloroflexota bacterium]